MRGKKSFYNACAAIVFTALNGFMGLVYTKLVLTYFGSDFNGINAAATQIVNMLLLLEGGFTVATNVALFKPYYEKDYLLVNQVIVATQNIFRRIGIFFLCLGLLISLIYSTIVSSDLPVYMIFFVLAVTVIPSAFNLYFTTKYRILLQAEQKEYIISLCSAVTVTLGYLVNFIVMRHSGNVYQIRLITMISSLINSCMIIYHVKKGYPFLDLSVLPRYDLIKGTKSIIIQKFTGVIYSTIPIIFISISVSASSASVYAVYNSLFALIKNFIHSIIDAPRFALGELAAIGDKKRLWDIFYKYQLVIEYILCVLLSTASVLILPFIKLYTHDITDINYQDSVIAFFMVGISFFELLHIPSGHLINMSGMFSISKNIQVIACSILIMLLFICGGNWGIYGILFAIFSTAVILAVLEIGYIHHFYFKNKLLSFMKLTLSLIIIFLAVVKIESFYINITSNYIIFILYGIILVVINSIIFIFVLLVICSTPTIECYQYCMRFLNKKMK